MKHWGRICPPSSRSLKTEPAQLLSVLAAVLSVDAMTAHIEEIRANYTFDFSNENDEHLRLQKIHRLYKDVNQMKFAMIISQENYRIYIYKCFSSAIEAT
jgi:type II secretory pathway component GspD/PulD (secretin)